MNMYVIPCYILNYNDMYTYDPENALNVDYYSKTYDNSDTLKINWFKHNIQSFVSDFDIKDCEMNKDKNDVTHISEFKK